MGRHGLAAQSRLELRALDHRFLNRKGQLGSRQRLADLRFMGEAVRAIKVTLQGADPLDDGARLVEQARRLRMFPGPLFRHRIPSASSQD